MAATKSAKNPTSGNDTPNTPEVSESAIARMKVGELRRELQGRGVKGTDDLKKPELVKKLIKLETAGAKSGRSTAKKESTAKKVRPAAVGRSTAKKLASAAGELPTTKGLLFAQTDLPSSDEVPTTLEVSEGQGNGSRGKTNSRTRTGGATAVIR